MLFDLRGRGRRRTIQAIYLSLAVLMGGGLVLFGIGGGTSGGLFDAFNSSGGGGGGSAGAAFTKRLDAFEQRTRANPADAAAYASLAKLRFQLASTGENYNQTQQAFTDKGKQQLRQSAAAWERYLTLDPAKPDPELASVMTAVYGQGGLQEYDKAVQAMEIVVDSRKATFQLYAQLAILAGAAKQDRKSKLAEDKALALAPKAQRKDLKAQIDLQKSQLANPSQTTTSQSG